MSRLRCGCYKTPGNKTGQFSIIRYKQSDKNTTKQSFSIHKTQYGDKFPLETSQRLQNFSSNFSNIAKSNGCIKTSSLNPVITIAETFLNSLIFFCFAVLFFLHNYSKLPVLIQSLFLCTKQD